MRKFLLERIQYYCSVFYGTCKFKSANATILGKVQCRGRMYIFRETLLNSAIKRKSIFVGKSLYINSGVKNNPIGGDTCTIIRTIDDGEIHIGDCVGMSNCAIVSRKKITIGNNVVLGGGVKIYDSDFHSLDYRVRRDDPFGDIKSSEIYIEDDVFIGTMSIVLKGVHIGRGSVIGAGSVVTRDVPPEEIWAGNPAHFIKKIRNDLDESEKKYDKKFDI